MRSEFFIDYVHLVIYEATISQRHIPFLFAKKILKQKIETYKNINNLLTLRENKTYNRQHFNTLHDHYIILSHCNYCTTIVLYIKTIFVVAQHI